MAEAAAPRGRVGGPGDAVVGVVPGEVVEPQTIDQAVEVMAACARDRQRLGFVGGATELGLGAAPEGLEVVLCTTSLDRVIEHAPLDQIVTVECGTRLAALQALLGRHGQMLALDPPWADRATIGGIVATSAFGPLRTRHGSVRDLVIGISFVRADATRARAGGKVVKNVAGFDLAKLLTGSLGTLGLITSVTFRLHPRPPRSASVIFGGVAAADMRRVLGAVREAQLEPEAAAALNRHAGPWSPPDGPDGWELGVRFAGLERAVAEQRERLAVVGRALGLGRAVELPDAASDLAFWERHRAAREDPADFRAKLAMLPTDPSSAEAFARLAEPLCHARAVLYPALGLGFVAGDAGAEPQAVAAALRRARNLVAARGGSVTVHDAPASVRALIDVWGMTPPPAHSALPLMRQVKARLDPDRRLAPGRFVGGI